MFTVEYVKNLQWENQEKTAFKCLAKYVEFDVEHPVGAHANDPYGHIQEIWRNGIAGLYGPIKEYDPFEGADNYRPENFNMPVTVFN